VKNEKGKYKKQKQVSLQPTCNRQLAFPPVQD